MKRILFALFIGIFITSCNQSSKNEGPSPGADSLLNNVAGPAPVINIPTADADPQVSEGTDFYASGNPSSWTLEMDLEKSIHFKADSVDLTMPIGKPTKSADGNTSRYQLKKGNDQLTIEVQRKVCENGDYTVTVTKGNRSYNGCGRNVSIYRLNDFWALEAINNTMINPADFSNGTPYMQINIPDKKISGFAGCNGINGSFTTTAKTISFGKMTASDRDCSSIDVEKKFLKYFSGHEVGYEFRGGKLYLQATPDSVFVYRKIQ